MIRQHPHPELLRFESSGPSDQFPGLGGITSIDVRTPPQRMRRDLSANVKVKACEQQVLAGIGRVALSEFVQEVGTRNYAGGVRKCTRSMEVPDRGGTG